MENDKEMADRLLQLYNYIEDKARSEAVSIAILEEIGKYRRGELANISRTNGNGRSSGSGKSNGFNGTMKNPNAPATDAQRNKLKSLGVEIPMGCTKIEASKLIDENQR